MGVSVNGNRAWLRAHSKSHIQISKTNEDETKQKCIHNPQMISRRV